MSKRARRGEVGSKEEKERKKDRMGPKSRAARIKKEPRAASSRAARHDATRQSDFSSHEPPPRISSDPPQPLERPFGPRKDWHAN